MQVKGEGKKWQTEAVRKAIAKALNKLNEIHAHIMKFHATIDEAREILGSNKV